MAREFNMVSPVVWRSKRVRALSMAAQLLLLYAMTSRHQNSSGCCHVPIAYGLEDLSISREDYETALLELRQARLVAWDEDTEEIYVCGWFRFNRIQNEKHRRGTMRLIGEIDSDRLREFVEGELEVASNAG